MRERADVVAVKVLPILTETYEFLFACFLSKDLVSIWGLHQLARGEG
jgi:hypothetical protein